MLKSVSKPITTVIAVTTLEVVAVADAGRAAFDRKPAITGDRADEQSEHEALQNAGNDVANEQGVEDQILEINEGDIEVGARNQRGRKNRGHARDDAQAGH